MQTLDQLNQTPQKGGMLSQAKPQEELNTEQEEKKLPAEKPDNSDNADVTTQSIKDDIAEAMPEEFAQAFAQVIKAGMKVLFSDETHELMLQQLEEDGEIAESAGNAIAGLMSMLYEKSNQSMPPEVIIPAGTYLMAEAADFIEQVTGETLTGETLSNAAAVMTETLMNAFGVDANKFVESSEQAMAKYSEGQE